MNNECENWKKFVRLCEKINKELNFQMNVKIMDKSTNEQRKKVKF